MLLELHELSAANWPAERCIEISTRVPDLAE